MSAMAINTKQQTYLFCVVLILFFCLYLVFITTRHHDIHWDEAVYISMGKYIYSAGNVGLFESIRPIGLPIILGALWKIGDGQVIAYSGIIFLFSLGTLVLTYLIGTQILQKKHAILATILLAITPFFFLSSVSILTEMPTAFFILLSLYLFLHNKYILTGFSTGIAFLMKFPAGIILATLFIICMAYKKYKHGIVILFSFLLTQIPYLLFNYYSYRLFTATAFDALFRPFLLAEGHAYNWLHAVSGIFSNFFYYPTSIVLANPLFAFAILGIFLLWRKKHSAVLYIPLILFFTYFTYIPNKQIRFAVLFLPFIALFSAAGIIYLQKTVRKYIPTLVFFCILVLFVIPMIYPEFVAAYRFFPTAQLDIETEYYSFFENKTGTLLTTEPYFSAYTDILAIPYYNNATDARELYERYKDTADYIVFNADFYPCIDDNCRSEIAALATDIETHPLLYQQEWDGHLKSIYLNNDLK